MKINILRFTFCILITLNFSLLTAQQKNIHTQLEELGMVRLKELDPTLHIHMMYAYKDNFVKEVLYDDLDEAYLHPLAAESLINAHQFLKEINPKYRFIIYDACRPMSVQQKMWNKVKGTAQQDYVSNPANGGGLHNYGMAVDISILDEHGVPLPMGTAVDHLGFEAHIDKESDLVSKGVLTKEEVSNRKLLRFVLSKAGFKALKTEWWHFNRISRVEARQKYQVIW